jgi:hypothetical protein
MKRIEVAIETAAGPATERTNRLRFTGAGGGEIIWEFTGDFVPHTPLDADFALVALLPFAMRYGLELNVRGALTRSLVEMVDECMDVWTKWRPDLFPHRVGIEADEWKESPPPLSSTNNAVLTFSAGVDATFALVAHQSGLLGRRSRKIAAGVMIHGFDLPLEQPDWFARAAAHARAIATEQQTALTIVRTNWRQFCVDWAMGHAFGLFAVLHQFHGRVASGILAADVDYGEPPEIWGNNTLTNRLLSGPAFPILECGGGYTRTEKVAAIAQYPAVRSHVRVCWEHPELGGNCGECEKCVRTQLNFMAAGFGSVPAFPRPLTPETVAGLRFRNAGQQFYLESLLRHNEGRSIPENIRAAIAEALGQPLRKPGLLRALRERLRIRQRIRVALAR